MTSAKFISAFAVVSLILMPSLFFGMNDFLVKTGDQTLQGELNLELLSSQPSWMVAGRHGLIESKKPFILSIFDRGIDNSLGRLAQINTEVDARLDKSTKLVAPIRAMFSDIDLTFIVRVILSLFAMLMTFDAVSGEKEQGTLSLVLSNAVPRHKVVLGKILGGFSALSLTLVLPLMIGLLALVFSYPTFLVHMSTDAWIRLGVMVSAYLVFLLVFFSAGLFVSSLCRHSATSFVALLTLWVLFAAIIPQLSLAAAERLLPYESYNVLQTRAFKEIGELHALRLQRFYENQGYGRAIRENRLPQLIADIMDAELDLQQEITDKYERQFRRQQDSQISFSTTLGRALSPTCALSFAVQSLAGTGWDRQREYLSQLREFQKAFRSYIVGAIESIRVDNYWDVFDALYRNKELDVDRRAVTFEFREESLAVVLSRCAWDMATLAIFAALFFAAAFVSFLRYDVR